MKNTKFICEASSTCSCGDCDSIKPHRLNNGCVCERVCDYPSGIEGSKCIPYRGERNDVENYNEDKEMLKNYKPKESAKEYVVVNIIDIDILHQSRHISDSAFRKMCRIEVLRAVGYIVNSDDDLFQFTGELINGGFIKEVKDYEVTMTSFFEALGEIFRVNREQDDRVFLRGLQYGSYWTIKHYATNTSCKLSDLVGASDLKYFTPCDMPRLGAEKERHE